MQMMEQALIMGAAKSYLLMWSSSWAMEFYYYCLCRGATAGPAPNQYRSMRGDSKLTGDEAIALPSFFVINVDLEGIRS